MKKQIFFLAVAALALASCSSENDVVQSPAVQQTTADEGVMFDAYQSRGLTRAGDKGVINSTSDLQSTEGFGVFGYYTDGENYSGITKPNFFYNQQVYWTGSSAVSPIPSNVWYYTPVKYWPNEFGSDAISDQVDRVTFFAYAPYVEVNPLTGIVTSSVAGDKVQNITSMTRNNVTGDPYIKYTCSMDATNSVDLLYGVAAEDFTSSNSAVNLNDIKKGRPYIDVVKPGLDAKIKFDFKHALAQMKVTVDAVVNTATQEGTNDIQSDYTRIWVRSVTFEGVTLSGSLNLNSIAPTPEWYDTNGNSKITTGSITVYDGRKDGKEALLEATNESPAMINSNLVQSAVYALNSSTNVITAPTEPGVTKTERNLFKSANVSDPVFCIPTGEKMKVTIVYDVETVDKNLAFYLSDGATQGSSIQNSITKTIDAFGEIKAGYCYNLKLHLGMRTVDFDADVTPWQDVNAETDLPSNLPNFTITKPHNRKSVILPADAGDYDFTVSGLPANTTPTKSQVTPNITNITSVTVNAANASGIAIGKISFTKNDDTKIKGVQNSDYVAIIDPNDNANKVYIDLKQSPQPLKLGLENIANNATTLTFTVNNDLKDALKKASAIANGGTLTLTKNGVVLIEGATNGYTLSGTDLTITLSGDAKAASGDVYTLYIQSGDATAESVTKSVP